MSVSFFPCTRCERILCDCGDHESCGPNCSSAWCNAECAAADGYDDGKEQGMDPSCKYCRFEDTDDQTLLHFLLAREGWDRDVVLKSWREANVDA